MKSDNQNSHLSGIDRFAANVREARGKRTQKEIAKAAGMPYQQYQKYEQKSCNPSVKTIERLADALGITWNQIMDGVLKGNIFLT